MVMAFSSFLLICLLGGQCPARSTDFTDVDRHAREAPLSAAQSVGSLASYLCEGARDDRERARTIFIWIASNIAYDVSCVGKKADAATVLSERRAVCAGYAVLFASLAKAAGLEAVVVYGEAKGPGPGIARSSDGLSNHDWNAVKLDGEWRLLDCAWGAGRLDDRGRFTHRFDEHYFLTPPDKFIYDHLPKESKWQLLARPLSRQEYLGQPEMHSDFFNFGLRLVSHENGYIEADGQVSITIAAPQDVCLMASLHQSHVELEEGYTFAQREPDGYQIRAVLPNPGDYKLRIYARRQGSGIPGWSELTRKGANVAAYESVVEYHLHTTTGGSTTFPKLYLSFQEGDCKLEGPLTGVLQAGKPVDFRISAPGAEDVRVYCDGATQPLARCGRDGIFSGTVALKPGEATVFARYPGQKRHVGLLGYVVQ